MYWLLVVPLSLEPVVLWSLSILLGILGSKVKFLLNGVGQKSCSETACMCYPTYGSSLLRWDQVGTKLTSNFGMSVLIHFYFNNNFVALNRLKLNFTQNLQYSFKSVLSLFLAGHPEEQYSISFEHMLSSMCMSKCGSCPTGLGLLGRLLQLLKCTKYSISLRIELSQ